MIGKLRNNGPKCKTAYNSLFVKHDKVSFSAIVSIGVTYGGYGGYAYPPLFGVGGTVPPTFWACDRINNSHFLSSSAHVSPYNIQGNVWRLGLRPRNCVA